MVNGSIKNFYAGKTILLTGSSGYIGYNLIKVLKDLKLKKIICLTSSKIIRSNYFKNKEIQVVQVDYKALKSYEDNIKSVDIIFHLASQTSVYRSEKDLLFDYESNVKPIQLIIQACKKHKNRADIIFAGTSTQCGLPKKNPVSEEHFDDPLTTYDLHKTMAESYLKYFTKMKFINGVSLRLTNVYGPGPKSSNSDRGILNLMIKKALKSEDLTVYGDGNYVRDYIYIDDIISSFVLAPMYIDKLKGNHFIIGSGAGATIKEAINLVREKAVAFGSTSIVKHIREPESLSIIEKRDFISDITRYKAITGFSIKTNLNDGITKTIKHFFGG